MLYGNGTATYILRRHLGPVPQEDGVDTKTYPSQTENIIRLMLISLVTVVVKHNNINFCVAKNKMFLQTLYNKPSKSFNFCHM